MYPLTPGESPENISKDYYSLAPIVMENPGIRNALTILYQKSQIDFTSGRLPKDQASVVIWSFMAHHQGIRLRDLLRECLKWLGGQWHVASRQPQKRQDYSKLLSYLDRGLKKAGVELRLNNRVSAETVKEEKPDAVVVATGATPAALNVPVLSERILVQANDVILGQVRTGDRVVVVGGRYLGMEIADQLADEGKKVRLVTRRSTGRGMERNVYLTLRNRLIQKGVHLFSNCPVVEIRENGVYIVFDNDLLFLEADTIVLAVGVRPEKELGEKLKGLVEELYLIGDCVEPRDVMFAIREGAEVGRLI